MIKFSDHYIIVRFDDEISCFNIESKQEIATIIPEKNFIKKSDKEYKELFFNTLSKNGSRLFCTTSSRNFAKKDI